MDGGNANQAALETQEQVATELKTPQESQDNIHNIFDSVFRTIVEYLPELVIPLINRCSIQLIHGRLP